MLKIRCLFQGCSTCEIPATLIVDLDYIDTLISKDKTDFERRPFWWVLAIFFLFISNYFPIICPIFIQCWGVTVFRL